METKVRKLPLVLFCITTVSNVLDYEMLQTEVFASYPQERYLREFQQRLAVYEVKSGTESAVRLHCAFLNF